MARQYPSRFSRGRTSGLLNFVPSSPYYGFSRTLLVLGLCSRKEHRLCCCGLARPRAKPRISWLGASVARFSHRRSSSRYTTCPACIFSSLRECHRISWKAEEFRAFNAVPHVIENDSTLGYKCKDMRCGASPHLVSRCKHRAHTHPIPRVDLELELKHEAKLNCKSE